MQHRMRISVFAAVAAGLAALMAWSGAEAAEAEIRSFSFECETPDGRVVKPLHGDIEGDTYSNLPAQRAQCLGTIDRKIALCWENTRFATEAENQEFADCLPKFRDQARACVGHFSFERSKCGTEDPLPVDDVAGEQEDDGALETTLGGRHRVKPVNRLMSAREAANIRTGPSPDYDIVGTVMSGDELHVTGEVRGRDWLRVAYPSSGDEAYIYGPLLRLVRQLPRATESASTPSAEVEASTPPAAEASASPRASGPSWSIAENQPCEVWNYGNTDYEPLTWSGPCMNGKASGSGRLVFRNGEGVYDGAMQGGRMHGRGGPGLGQRPPLRGRASRRQAARAGDTHPGHRRALRGRLARGQATRPGQLHASRRHHLRGRLARRLLRRARRPLGLDRDDGGGLRLRIAP